MPRLSLGLPRSKDEDYLEEYLTATLDLLRGKNGGRGRDRTCDQSIKSRMLYQLSYASKLDFLW